MAAAIGQALTAAGFDVTCGILYAGKAGRGSLVYDWMEPFRPKVDRLVLDFLSRAA
jgi:CRISPR/Cas system-associated endonuclease Cas1